jgi:ABC-2 type transport system permease protein
MLIVGNGNISGSKAIVQDTVIEEELNSQIQKRAINYYSIADDALTHFDETFVNEYQSSYVTAMGNGMTQEQAQQYASASAYSAAATDLQSNYYPSLIKQLGYDEGSSSAQEVQGVIFYTLNPVQQDGTYMFDSFYSEHGEQPPRYNELLANITDSSHADERDKYVMTNTSIFLAGNMVQEDNIQSILSVLSDYGVTMEKYEEFGFKDYNNLKQKAVEVLVDYRANLEYRIDNIKEGETVDGIKAEITSNLAGSLLTKLPDDLYNAIDEIGQADLYGLLVGSIFFKMAGLLLPIIYMIMASNALVAGQVDSGSMAYILSTGTKRREVTFTQAIFLIGSLFVMFLCTTITSLICFALVDVSTKLTYGKLILINIGAFLVMFAMSGISFLASCYCNRSKHSMAIGGGLNMFFLVATMLGLFGSPILPSIIRMEPLNVFNYVSIISLFDVVSILHGTTDYIWKGAILIVIGIVCYIAGSRKFEKKDLPL